MRKIVAVFLVVVMAVLFSANFVFAGDATVEGDGAAVGIDNDITNNNAANSASQSAATATGGNAIATGGNADVRVSTCNVAQGGAGGSVNNSGNSSVKDSGNSSANNKNSVKNTVINDYKRNHITVQPGPSGNFIATGTASVEGWRPFVCQPLFQIFSAQRMEHAASGTNIFFDKKGGFLNGLFSDNEKAVIHIPFNGEPDNKPIVLINWEPSGLNVWPGDELLGEFECAGDYGAPRGQALAKCLSEAKKKTNTDRAFAYYRVRMDAKTSGFSYGSGAAAAKAMGGGSAGDNISGSISLGGIIGSSNAFVDVAYDWYILALNRGNTAPPNGMLVCGEIPQPAAPPTPQYTEPPAPAPAKCNPDEIWVKIRELEREVQKCTRYCFNNLKLRYALEKAYIDLYVCSGETRHLDSAIYHAEVAERNYRKGYDIAAHRAEADQVVSEVWYFQAGAINVARGERAASSFAVSKKLERYPKRFAR